MSQPLLKGVLENPLFDKFIMFVIVVNAISLGLETVPEIYVNYGKTLKAVDFICLYIFSFEIILKLSFWRAKTFKDPWNIFDIFIVGIAWIPSAGAFAVLRSLRILRALRLISTVPRLKKVVSGLLTSLPGLGAVSAILVLLFYIGAVMSTKLFGASFPDWFGSISKSFFSLFQIMTLESWSMGIVRPVMEKHPFAWAFFVPFILVTTFTTLNLLIAVLVNAMQSETESAAEERAIESHFEREQILAELKELNAKVEKLSNK